MGWSDLFGKNKQEGNALPWEQLTATEQLEGVLKDSHTRPQLIFKHSSRCSISSMALERFGREWDTGTGADLWFLDLIRYRDVSNAVAVQTGITHQSPQVVVLMNGQVTHDASHSGISAQAAKDAIAKSL